MVHFANLEALAANMRNQNPAIPSSVFPVVMTGHQFSCLFIDVHDEPVLYITSLGNNPFTIKLKGDKGFNFSVYLGDMYQTLYDYLGLHPNGNEPFLPSTFFEEFDTHIPTEHLRNPHPRDIARAVNLEERNVDEAARIYFCGWHPLPEGHNVSELNFKKTCGLIGYNEAVRLRDKHISSNWTANEDMEQIEAIALHVNY